MARPRNRRKHKKMQNKNLPATATKPTINVETERPSQSVMGMAFHGEYYKGPLPPPDYLRQYEDMYPGAAQKMIDAGIRQTDHRIGIENKAMDAQIARADKGVNFGFVLGLVGIGGGIAIVFFAPAANAAVAGSIISVGSLAGLVSVFVIGTNSQRKERVQKSKDNP